MSVVFFYLVKSCIFAFFSNAFSYRFVYYGVVLLFAFGRTDRILLLIKKAVVREGVQSHQKFKNRKGKNTKFKTCIDFMVMEESGKAEPSRSLGKC